MHVGIKAVVKEILIMLMVVSFCLFMGSAAKEATPSVDEEVRAFATYWLELSQDNKNFDEVMLLYADEVIFYKLGRVKREAVRADKRKYFDRWPSREHRLISVAVGPATKNNAKEVSVSFHYKIKNTRGMVKEGDANAILILQRVKNAFVTVSEKEATAAALQLTVTQFEDGMRQMLLTNKLRDIVTDSLAVRARVKCGISLPVKALKLRSASSP